MAISATLLHTNRNALAGADGVFLYNTAFAGNLTLGQLMAAVCLRSGAIFERQSVMKMNVMGKQTGNISDLSKILSDIAANSAPNWPTVKNRLINDYEVPEDGLPEDLGTHNKRMQAMAAIKQRLETITQQSQRDMIDMQSAINRRDVAFTTATNLIRSLGQSKSNIAGKLTR